MFAGAQGRAYYHNKDCVTAVYLGARISDGDRREVMNRLGELKIKLRTMTISKYYMSFEAGS